MQLSGRTALVTGGGQGIGRSIALALAREGCDVAVLDLAGERAEAVAADLAGLGVKSLGLRGDVSRGEDMDAAVAAVVRELGHLDVLVNNAGWDRMALFLDSDEATWDRLIAVNLKGVLHASKAALPHMVARRQGKVINIASDAGRVGSSGEAVYSATKGAVIAFTKALAREMARHGVTVNVVCPGLTETALLQSLRDQSPKMERILEAVARATPLGRTAQPDEIAGAVVFLASPAADFITGQTLSVSGGLTMC